MRLKPGVVRGMEDTTDKLDQGNIFHTSSQSAFSLSRRATEIFHTTVVAHGHCSVPQGAMSMPGDASRPGVLKRGHF